MTVELTFQREGSRAEAVRLNIPIHVRSTVILCSSFDSELAFEKFYLWGNALRYTEWLSRALASRIYSHPI